MDLKHAMTLHAKHRSQQRGIPQWVVEMILEYGEQRDCRDEGKSWILTGGSLRSIKRDYGAPTSCEIARFKNVYVVMVESAIVTVAFARKALRSTNYRNKRRGA